jgi:hypothetical protein
MITPQRGPGTWLTAIAKRAFDRVTLETVVLPAIDDLQHECAEERGTAVARLRAYWGVWKVFAFCGTQIVARDSAYTFAIVSHQMTMTLLIITGLVLWPVIVSEFPRWSSRTGTGGYVELALLLLPQALVISLPSAHLIALATIRPAVNALDWRRLLSGVAVGSVGCALLLLALLLFVVPAANESYRRLSFHSLSARSGADISKPPLAVVNEMDWFDLTRAMADSSNAPLATTARARLHLHFAYSLTPFVLGLFGLGLIGRWSYARTVATSAVLLVLYSVLFSVGAHRATEHGQWVGEIWMADVGFGVLGVLVVASAFRRKARSG